MPLETIEINSQFKAALDLMENSSEPVFVTGRAGTGKSTLLSHFCQTTGKAVAVLAPTGVAAINVRGQTIHSFFGFKPDITTQQSKALAMRAARYKEAELYQKLETLVIDEISMVRADLLDCMDVFLRTVRKRKQRPFGGVQIIMIGDLYQLPPVVTTTEREIFKLHYASPYFFSSHVFSQMIPHLVELETVYRQKDQSFIDLLNAVRNNSLTDEQIEAINACYEPDFDSIKSEDFYIHLTSTNEQASLINRQRLDSLPGALHTFEGVIDGNFEQKNYPTEWQLQLKKNAQVMLLNNDPSGRWVNGTMGIITEISTGQVEEIKVELENGREDWIKPVRWEILHYDYDEKEKTLVTEPVGAFTQYPLKLAWAITIHKSQGKTFDRVILDVGRGTFATGQMYVALSRCRHLKGLILKKPLRRSHVFVDQRIVSFLTSYTHRKPVFTDFLT